MSLGTAPNPSRARRNSSRPGPYIETRIADFGPERAIFESNFPVDKGSCRSAALWRAFKRVSPPVVPPARKRPRCEAGRRNFTGWDGCGVVRNRRQRQESLIEPIAAA